MLVKHFCFEDNRTQIFENLSKIPFLFGFFFPACLQIIFSVCSSDYFFLVHCVLTVLVNILWCYMSMMAAWRA